LRRADASSGEQPRTLRAPRLAKREAVLVVDDDDAIRNVIVRVLRQQGYAVLSAASGEEAVLRSQAYEGRLDLVVTDVMMPGMNGRQLFDQLVASRAGLRVLYISGYTDDVLISSAVDGVNPPFLQKPFTPEILAQK